MTVWAYGFVILGTKIHKRLHKYKNLCKNLIPENTEGSCRAAGGEQPPKSEGGLEASLGERGSPDRGQVPVRNN